MQVSHLCHFITRKKLYLSRQQKLCKRVHLKMNRSVTDRQLKDGQLSWWERLKNITAGKSISCKRLKQYALNSACPRENLITTPHGSNVMALLWLASEQMIIAENTYLLAPIILHSPNTHKHTHTYPEGEICSDKKGKPVSEQIHPFLCKSLQPYSYQTFSSVLLNSQIK